MAIPTGIYRCPICGDYIVDDCQKLPHRQNHLDKGKYYVVTPDHTVESAHRQSGLSSTEASSESSSRSVDYLPFRWEGQDSGISDDEANQEPMTVEQEVAYSASETVAVPSLRDDSEYDVSLLAYDFSQSRSVDIIPTRWEIPETADYDAEERQM